MRYISHLFFTTLFIFIDLLSHRFAAAEPQFATPFKKGAILRIIKSNQLILGNSCLTKEGGTALIDGNPLAQIV